MEKDSTKLSECLTVEPLLSSYAAGALEETSERLVRDHLAACAACRTVQMERDPSVLFLELRRPPLPNGFLDGFAAGVRRRLESEASPRLPFFDWIATFGTRRVAFVAGPLMTLLLLGTLFLVRPGSPRFRGFRNPDQGVVTSPYVVPHGSARPGQQEMRAPDPLPVVSMEPSAGLPLAPPLLEEVGSPGARVYRFTVESGGDETPIYFVVDESIDI